MALSDPVTSTTRPDAWREFNFPSAHQSDWVVVCDAPETAETGDAVVSGKVVRPGSITREAQRLFLPSNRGANLLISLKYDVGLTAVTSPIVRVFGKDNNGVWQVLTTSDGTHEITLTIALTTDVRNDAGTFRFTTPVEVGIAASRDVIVAVQTALDGTGTKTNSEILVKTS